MKPLINITFRCSSYAVFFAVGVFGGLTAKRSILYTQALPALITLALLYFSA
ncbi:MAG: DUF1304 family protein [Bacteroidetes bacterium]|nr:DUF1304 family protein [Bacteroidota bacterium]